MSICFMRFFNMNNISYNSVYATNISNTFHYYTTTTGETAMNLYTYVGVALNKLCQYRTLTVCQLFQCFTIINEEKKRVQLRLL